MRDVSWDGWPSACDTLHAHTQVLGKIARGIAPPEPQLQHAALRLTARGWETAPLPTAGGAFGVALDLRTHEAVVEHSDGRAHRLPLTPNRSVGEVTREVLAAARELAGHDFEFNPKPSEVPWTTPLDGDEEHRTYDTHAVRRYFDAALGAAAALAAFRAPYRGRSSPVNAWWGSFDLAVSLYSGRAADPPSDDFIFRNAMDSEEFVFGWWPGDARYPRAAFYVYVHPARDGFGGGDHWNAELGEHVLDWGDVGRLEDATAFARRLFARACGVCEWDPALLTAPPVV